MMTVSTRPFGILPDGQRITAYTISNGVIEMQAMTYGAIITSLRTADRRGNLDDVVLGHERLESYLHNPAYLGALVGRYANRIAHGRFALDGVEYDLPRNDRGNHLHGGERGFDKHVWRGTAIQMEHACGVVFTRTSPDGEEGYPGRLDVVVRYLLDDANTITLEYEASTDEPTIVNLTQHTYFNLEGPRSADARDHELTLNANGYTPVDEAMIPIGVVASVVGTPFDFRASGSIRAHLRERHEQLARAGGFDHNMVLAREHDALRFAARLHEPTSGRTLEISTTEPGLQFYDGHLLDGAIGAYGRVLAPHAGVCLETQHFPDSPNQPRFPSVVLRPAERYRSLTTWRFSAT